MMSEKITETAILICNKGAKPSELKVTSQDFCMAENKLIATENDKQAETNIPNFSACSITRSQCNPAVLKWENTAERDTINNYKILTDKSTCQCSTGGKISVQFKGYNEKHNLDY